MGKKKSIDYSPLLEHEWVEAVNIVETVRDRIPENMAKTVWFLHNKILGTNERQPCTCASSGKHWLRAFTTIKEFVQRVNG
jgi:hypothetical protein